MGTYTSSLGGGGSIKGQLTETDFRFELTQTIQGCPGIYKGDGTRIGDNIAGSYTGNDCLGDRGTGTFTMTWGTGIEPTSHSTSSVNPVPDDCVSPSVIFSLPASWFGLRKTLKR